MKTYYVHFSPKSPIHPEKIVQNCGGISKITQQSLYTLAAHLQSFSVTLQCEKNAAVEKDTTSEKVGKSSQPDEYEYDSSDEEDIRNTIGNIPINWYDEHEHLGYNLDGKQIRKPKRGDELDAFLAKVWPFNLEILAFLLANKGTICKEGQINCYSGSINLFQVWI